MTERITLGLVPAPGLCEQVARRLADELPGLLEERVDPSVTWEVQLRTDPLTGSDLEAPDLLPHCEDRQEREGWDMALFLTDLPILRSKRIVVATESQAKGVGGVSLPALGACRLHRRARNAVLQLVREIAEPGREAAPEAGQAGRRKPRRRARRRPRLFFGPLSQLLAPIRRHAQIAREEADIGGNVEYTTPKRRGLPRLLAGMVLNNSPRNLFLSFRGALAAAAATGAYAVFFTSVHQVSVSLGETKLLALMAVSLASLTGWTIVAHHLWEAGRYKRSSRGLTVLYNTVTVLTMSTAAFLFYLTLFVLLLAGAWLFVPENVFRAAIQNVIKGYPLSWPDYLTLAWLASSLATIGGALGSGLEDEENVRQAAFGYRQRIRTGSEST
ncbi:hypothetical protein AN478_03710 [Thiohalorhabdus denitrificans]|uniref:5,10-methylene-tetrahydrofolate dehydrogenase n=1 Tax=Thiohalorhabdus denitrificans TaxID=381306 RepID=A0A0P9CE00_9GAMM|nr:hypothetical protein [Thiohalorhabdus denitrificans]KPV41042.1 hypothetical protein AN478_03710 [Thiohalorhabdus denitrificans]SCY40609.1 hypothetical protein SAMN05661077_2036 [Thiohalorhabdus denitrificans]